MLQGNTSLHSFKRLPVYCRLRVEESLVVSKCCRDRREAACDWRLTTTHSSALSNSGQSLPFDSLRLLQSGNHASGSLNFNLTACACKSRMTAPTWLCPSL
jgi:hypothetical protein